MGAPSFDTVSDPHLPQRSIMRLHFTIVVWVSFSLAAGCSSSGGGGGGNVGPQNPYCTAEGDTNCTCQSDVPDSPKVECSASQFDDGLCCATPGWPETGGCKCERWGCRQFVPAGGGASACQCGRGMDSFNFPNSGCSNSYTYCCKRPGLTCICSETACLDFETQVPDCETPAPECAPSTDRVPVSHCAL
jgi:hypothetical protein